MTLVRYHDRRNWYLRFRTPDGHERTWSIATDKRTSQAFADRVRDLMDCRRHAVPLTHELREWLGRLSDKVLARMVTSGLIDASEGVPLELTGLVKRYKAALEARERAPAHVRHTVTRINAVLAGVSVMTIGALRPEAVENWLKLQRTGGLSASTSNHYVAAAKAFTRWLLLAGVVDRDPLVRLARVRVDALSLRRRALTDTEVDRLLTVTATGATRHCVPAAHRVILYRLALETGLRAGELRSLTVQSFELAAKPPTVTVAAGSSKRRTRDVLPLTRDLAGALRRTGLAAMLPFRVQRTADMLRDDLAAARIKSTTADGTVVDFHALRHTFITRLARGGVHPKLAQALARHSTIALTMDHYTHTVLADLADAVERTAGAPRSRGKRLATTGNDLKERKSGNGGKSSRGRGLRGFG